MHRRQDADDIVHQLQPRVAQRVPCKSQEPTPEVSSSWRRHHTRARGPWLCYTDMSGGQRHMAALCWHSTLHLEGSEVWKAF